MLPTRCVAYDGDRDTDATGRAHNPYLRLEWKPDVTTLINEGAKLLFPPVREAEEVAPVSDKFD